MKLITESVSGQPIKVAHVGSGHSPIALLLEVVYKITPFRGLQ